ncbi:hypothetical protein SDRG_10632 [Saprolegnia diclina VS20]|uniref:Uncharacterized protein n=1 Tax=Saprolegnia diclina (strain VS20) TaxID=1156394 RepID=T0QE47_SAPDV|nr:hypothetical protein SDRG_10632 [Saprolegnia diclina VS20]EQC31845.1 hypothetical protein SDRG_10632 [Saprolegnia diclina VS20]|eukprot:XP_008614852.1 hypothetical protein SDRG_10632 [Saprolegnia diclina VS20]
MFRGAMTMPKRSKPSVPKPTLPQNVFTKIVSYLDRHTTFFAALDALATVERDPFLLALSTLRQDCAPWQLWPLFHASDVAAASGGLGAVFDLALSNHPLVQLETNSPVRYFSMVSGDVHLTADAAILVHLNDASLAKVTDLAVEMAIGQSLQGVMAHVTHARRLRSLSLSLNIREFTQEATPEVLREAVPSNLRSMRLNVFGRSTPLADEATARYLAQVLLSLPITALELHSVRMDVFAARVLYDAMVDAPKLCKMVLMANTDLACMLAAFGQPWTCHRPHEHESSCNERAFASAKLVFPNIESWTIVPRQSETSRALQTLAVMTHARRFSVHLLGDLDETDFVTKLLPRLGRLSRLQGAQLSGQQLFANASRVALLIETLRELRHLSSLRLNYTGLATDGLRSLLPLMAAHPQLAHVDLGENNLADDAVPLLKQVIAMPQMQSLWVTANNLTDRAKHELCDYLRQLRRSSLHLGLDDGDLNCDV